ncbi:unnamed protein product [Schistosoma turkestanicum]|nr:unnamed protein product [Schistosoma turkestanicum]
MGDSNIFLVVNTCYTYGLSNTFSLRRPSVYLHFIIFAQVLAVVCSSITTVANDVHFSSPDDLSEAIDDQNLSTNNFKYEESSPDDIVLEDTWRYKPFPGVQIPVARSPHPTFGSPWPLPHSWLSSSCYYNVDIKKFHFKFIKTSNKILQSAVNRYTHIIQNLFGISVYPKVWQHKNFQSRCEKPVTGSQGIPFRTVLRTSNGVSHNFISQQISYLMHKYGLPGHSVLHSGIQKYALLYVINSDSQLPHINMDESYILGVSENGIFIIANETWGALRGLETLSQLMWTTKDQSQIFVNQTYIVDFPRFKHRGLMIDTSRHFMSKSVILLNLEAMSYNKLNVLHWHIVDDQSFPYQSNVFPELSAQGAYREDLVYTSNDIKEILEFARLRGIRVIPEFDIPGHTRSLSLSHPEIMSQCSKSGHFGPLNPVSNNTYEFLENLLREVFQLFLDDSIHLGGDEVETICWERDPKILNNVESTGQFSSTFWTNYFWRRVQNLVTEIGRKNPQLKRNLILWHDVLHQVTEFKKSQIIQVWNGRPSDSLSQGYNVIYSSCWYLDSLKDIKQWTNFYLCEPADDAPMGTEQQIIGGEACMWSEYQSDYTVLTRIWPTTSAVAERLWSSKNITNLETAGPRIEEQRCRLINRGIPAGVLLGPGYCDGGKLMPTWNINEIMLDEYKNIMNRKKSNNNSVIDEYKNDYYYYNERPSSLWNSTDMVIGFFIGILITLLFRHRNLLPFRKVNCNFLVRCTTCLLILTFITVLIIFSHTRSIFV